MHYNDVELSVHVPVINSCIFHLLQVINIFIATASFQAMLEKDGVKKYYHDQHQVTHLVRACFCLSAVHTFIHAILLFRVRTFLNMAQLRTICGYKLIVNLVLPFFWFPELSPNVEVNQLLMFAIRGCLISSYLSGYLWAGQAERFSKVLSSEKTD
jgi:hypothetical protein